MIPRWSSAQAVLGIVVVSGRGPRVDRNGVWKTTGRGLLTFQLSALARIWDIGPCRGAWPACVRGVCTTVCRREQSGDGGLWNETKWKKKRKWKWPASRTPPVEGRTSREEAQTMRNEPEQDIEPENPGVVCVVHAPSLARMCRDEDPALDKIWVQNKKRPASVLAPWQNPPVTQRECGGGADTPPPLPTKQKDAKFYLSCFSLHWRR